MSLFSLNRHYTRGDKINKSCIELKTLAKMGQNYMEMHNNYNVKIRDSQRSMQRTEKKSEFFESAKELKFGKTEKGLEPP